MALFGSSWDEDSREVGPFSHWLEDFTYPEPEETELDKCKRLRLKTGMGLLNCKKCLQDYNWDFERALENYHSYRWDGKL